MPTIDTSELRIAATYKRLRIVIRGIVQGVGFRPFVYRLAEHLGLAGRVSNSSEGVIVEAEGPEENLRTFLLDIEREKPPRSSIQSLEYSFLEPYGYGTFEISESSKSEDKTALVMPDIAACPDCLEDIFNITNRRYMYPFTTCTNCGPRFSIIKSLPYDRKNTTMADFTMCADCQAEYQNPLDRRFHAETNACPKCGPHIEIWDGKGELMVAGHGALLHAAGAIRSGNIVAVKGIGGFQLIVKASNEAAIRRLRRLKNRDEKPFALMCPDLESVKKHCAVSTMEERLLKSPEAPIVLLHRKQIPLIPPLEKGEKPEDNPPFLKGELGGLFEQLTIAPSVAPGNPYLGIMLPYSPLHHLLMRELGTPVVATSGNLADEPICTDETEAVERLAGVADIFLAHNRPIVRHVDDSVVRVLMARELVLRRARGYAPLPATINKKMPVTLAVGAHQKNTVAISVKNNVFISQHIGDLDTPKAVAAFENVSCAFEELYDLKPAVVVCDLHPDYYSTKYAESRNVPLVRVQHHYSHILSCMAENDLAPPLLGVAWDGTGWGLDGTVWGGEFLEIDGGSFKRTAHFRTFRLPGSEKAVKEPRRAALGLLYELFGDELIGVCPTLPFRLQFRLSACAFAKFFLHTPTSMLKKFYFGSAQNPKFRQESVMSDRLLARKEPFPIQSFSSQELDAMFTMLKKNVNSPLTSSAGRLFDAVAGIIGLRQYNNFEGQAAMKMEYAIEGFECDDSYPFMLTPGTKPLIPAVIDWEPMVKDILNDTVKGVHLGLISAKFHNTLVEIIVEVAKISGQKKIVLSGGCFQNAYLTERAVKRLTYSGFKPYWHQRIPPNDGGISLGQIMAAALAGKCV